MGPDPPDGRDRLTKAMLAGIAEEVLAAKRYPCGLVFGATWCARVTGQRNGKATGGVFTRQRSEPLAGCVARELSDKLATEIKLGFAGRFAADLAGRHAPE